MVESYPLLAVYGGNLPDVLLAAAETPCMQRLKHIGMNCGCEYTSFPRFRQGKAYNRYLHSLGVARIVWHFTGDAVQALAGLLHDAATPCFAHVVDFLRGDYLQQEATEAETREILLRDTELQTVLRQYGIRTEQVEDYHLYPIADNPSPKVSADRVEYTLGNLLHFGFAELKEVQELYENLQTGTVEGESELVFRDRESAERYGMLSLACSRVYVSPEDRYAMQMLSEILRDALTLGVLTERELYGTEQPVVYKLETAPELCEKWAWFQHLHSIRESERPTGRTDERRIRAKRRYMDPYVLKQGRLSAVSASYRQAVRAFLEDSQERWICPADGSDAIWLNNQSS